jgi:ketosteroid isomerase-like protein
MLSHSRQEERSASGDAFDCQLLPLIQCDKAASAGRLDKVHMSDVRILSEIRERLTAAENAGDPEPICAAMAEDIVLMVPNAPVREGKAACAAFVREVLPGLLLEFEREIAYTSAEVRVLGDIAFDRGTFAFSVAPRAGGSSELNEGKYFWLYARSERLWKLTRVIVSLDEKEAEAASTKT